MTQNSGPRGSWSRAVSPWLELLPGPVVHADLSPAPALAATHRYGAAARVEIGLGERQRLADPQSGTPQHDDQAAQALPVNGVASGGRSAWKLLGPFVERPVAASPKGQPRRRAVTADRAAAEHGKHQRSSRERMLAAVRVGWPRRTALNADFAPKRLRTACAQFECRVRRGR
jgi:hypothetical protein